MAELSLLALPGLALEKTFLLNGTNATLTEVTDEVGVRFGAMRFNPTSSRWSLDLALTNKSYRAMPGPVVVLIDGFSGTSGPQQPDATDGGNPAKAYYDFTTLSEQGQLWPGETSGIRTVQLGFNGGSPNLIPRVFANLAAAGPGLALVRTLTELGQPFPGVTVLETGPGGNVMRTTDSTFALATLGGSNGEHTWMFSAPERLPVWRRESLRPGEVTLVFNPRLTPRMAPVLIPLAGGSLTTSNGGIRVQFSPGAFSQNASASLTPLTAQTLPMFLPLGWSPLQAWSLELSAEPSIPIQAAVLPWGSIHLAEQGALVRWNVQNFRWEVVQLFPGAQTNSVTVTLPGSATYALVVADVGATAPPPAQPGQPLPSGSGGLASYDSLTAGGQVSPGVSLASSVPELVTATARIAITNQANGLVSGLPLRCEVQEQYQLRDGTRRTPPQYENFVIGYQRPGDASPSTLLASFPMQPLLLFGRDTLDVATVNVDVLPLKTFTGRVLDSRGGQVPGAGVIVSAAVGDLTSRQAIQLRALNPTNFADSIRLPVWNAFDLSVGGIAEGHRLSLQVPGLPTNSYFVLARVLSSVGHYGLEPIERLLSDANGVLKSLEPVSGDRLPGITGAGQYLLVQVSAPQGLIRGIAKDVQGQAVAGLPVRVTGQPWLTYSGINGSYRLVAPVGSVEVVTTDPGTGDLGLKAVTVANPNLGVTADIGAVPSGPRVVSVTPTNSAVSVSRVTAVVIQFSEPINPGSLVSNSVQLLGASNQPVAVSRTLNRENSVLTLVPVSQLSASTLHTIRLATNLTDSTGLPLEGPRQFTFTTESDVLVRQVAQVISYEPTNGFAAMYGSPGTAEPNSAVILVNETSGQTATVLSKPDGSFSNSVPASVDDFLSAALVNKNGTRNTIPVSRQLFADGSIGLFNGGGILSAVGEGRTVECIVDSGAIPTKTRFKLELISSTQIKSLTSNTPPLYAQLLGPGIRLATSGDSLRSPVHVSVTVTLPELEAFGLSKGGSPTNATYGLALLAKADSQVFYWIVDKMEYENGKLVTHSPPFHGPPTLDEERHSEWAQIGLQTAGLLNPIAAISQEMLMLPLMMGMKAQPIIMTGRVIQQGLDENNAVVFERPLPGTFVSAKPTSAAGTVTRPGRLDPGVMYAVAQADGRYAIHAPRITDQNGDTDLYILTASNPKQSRETRVIVHPAQSGFTAQDIYFQVSAAALTDTRPPTISIGHSPVFPETNADMVLTIVASHSSFRPTIQLDVISVEALIPGGSAASSDVVMGASQHEDIGEEGRRSTIHIQCAKPARVEFSITAESLGANQGTARYVVYFGGAGVTGDNPPGSDVEDKVGPQVVSTFPSQQTQKFPLGQPIRIEFSEAVDSGITNLGSIHINPSAGTPYVELSDNRRVLGLRYMGMSADTDYTLTLGPGITDIALPVPNSLDQNPATAASDAYTLNFHTGSTPGARLPNIEFGGGVVVRGIYAFALERLGALDGALVVYDLSKPDAPSRVAELNILGYPRDLALIPAYSFVRSPNSPPETKTLLAIVGGKVGGVSDQIAGSYGGAIGNIVGNGQYLWIIDISNPLQPVRIAGTIATYSPTAALTKVDWSPPYLTYLETDADVQKIGLVNLQAFIYGLSLTTEEYFALPDFFNGVDANLDGDFVDTAEGDQLPIPGKERDRFAGLTFAFTLDDSNQRIQDFSWDSSTAKLGVVVGGGSVLDLSGEPTAVTALPAYRTLYSNGSLVTRSNASITFSEGEPKRVLLMPQTRLTTVSETRIADLAILSVVPKDITKPSQIVVIDITHPTLPTPLTTNLIDVAYGVVQSIMRRDDGKLLVATSRDVFIVDPAALLSPVQSGSGFPGLVGIVPGQGSGSFSFGGSVAGLNVVNLGGNSHVSQSSPQFTFVSIPRNPFAPSDIVDRPAQIAQVLSDALPTSVLRPARFRSVASQFGSNLVDSTLSPPASEAHYYVRVDAPGSAGETIELSLETLNASGDPIRDKGPGFPPVHSLSAETLLEIGGAAVSDCHPALRSLTAYRLSSDKADPAFNVYLSKPIALTYEAYTTADLDNLKRELDREILWSGSQLRVGLDPKKTPRSSPLSPFAGTVIARVIRPGAATIAATFPADYIMGPNPPHVTGHTAAPGTFGTVSAHNGELRVETTDIVLPSRRMPIVFKRTIAGQDLYEGPFGRGCDFNYNERLVELKGGFFQDKSVIPLIVRGNERDEIGRRSDLLFHNGMGRTVIFRFVGKTPPSEFATDPLAADLGWLDGDKVRAYYMPQPGVFEMMVQFTDGKFARLDPQGTQSWYGPNGRLEKIQDRYKNAIVLSYNDAGELRRIDDKSVHSPRYLMIGRYRASGTGSITLPDEATPDAAKVGKIRRLIDYTGRDVLFDYDACGSLIERKGIEVTSPHQDAFNGRALTKYEQSQTQAAHPLAGGHRGISAGSETAATLFTAQIGGNVASPVVEGGIGAGAQGSVTIDVQHENTAKALGSGPLKRTVVTTPDNAATEFTLSALGLPLSVKMSGPGADPSEMQYGYDTNGLVTSIIYPEGNSVTFTYDPGNVNLRSRANLKRVKRDPGPRGNGGSEPIPEAFFERYDSRYNFPIGGFRDFNGKTITYHATSDGLDIGKVDYEGARSVTMHYNRYGQLDRETTIEGFVREYHHDDVNGFTKQQIRGDSPALVTRYEYEGLDGDRGLPTRITFPEAANSAPLELAYDAREQLITIKRGNNKILEKRSFDLNGNLVRLSQKLDTDKELIETRHYRQNGFLDSVTLKEIEKDSSTSEDLTVTYTPDAMYRVSEVRFPGNEIQQFHNYDHLGRYHKMVLGDYTEEYGYDKNGNMVTIARGGVVDEHQYDGHDRKMLMKLADEAGVEQIRRTFYGNGHAKTLTVTDSQNNVNREVGYEVDSYGRTSKTIVATDGQPAVTETIFNGLTVILKTPGNEQAIFTYNDAGQLISRQDSTRTITYESDGNGNVKSISALENGTATAFVRSFTPYNELDQSKRFSDNLGAVADYDPRFDGMQRSITDSRAGVTRFAQSKLGETLGLTRPDGVEFRHAFSPNRSEAAVADRENKGRTFTYDNFRLRGTKLRDESIVEVSDYDPRNRQPKSITIPGGSIALTTDPQGRLRGRTVEFAGDTREETFDYDALDRLRSATYPHGSVSLAYHKLGALKKAIRTIRGTDYVIEESVRNDGVRLSLTYPSDPAAPFVVSEARDLAGRLGTLIPSEGAPIVSQNNYAATDLVGVQVLGANLLKLENIYDSRKRLVIRRYTRISDSKLLAEVRYAYDSTDNVVARQYVHRAARSDFFGYDAGHRLIRGDFGVRPQINASEDRSGYGGFSKPDRVPGNWSPGYFGRSYAYDPGGLDRLTTISNINPSRLSMPAFAHSIGSPDQFLLPQFIDTFTTFARSSDLIGNPIRHPLFTRPAVGSALVPVGATLAYDGKSQLLRLTRDDGISLQYDYDERGFRFYRQLTDPSLPAGSSETAFIYHQGLLLAEYDRTSGNDLKARYYYHNGDVPVAADLRKANGQMERYYVLQDVLGSVLGLVDATGNVVERYFYDAWGQPEIQLPDTSAPRIVRVVTAPDGVFVQFSEHVLPPAIAASSSSELIGQLRDLAGAITVTTNGTRIPGTILYDESATNFGFGTVVRFKPDGSLVGNCVLTLESGRVVDEWNNPNDAAAIGFSFSPQIGTELWAAADTSVTDARLVARSSMSWPLLYHGQYLDYDAGLSYMRARFYDPSSGLFLQQDPMGYEDSVNLYAAFGQNPTSLRDPTGTVSTPPRGVRPPKLVRIGTSERGVPIYAPKIEIDVGGPYPKALAHNEARVDIVAPSSLRAAKVSRASPREEKTLELDINEIQRSLKEAHQAQRISARDTTGKVSPVTDSNSSGVDELEQLLNISSARSSAASGDLLKSGPHFEVYNRNGELRIRFNAAEALTANKAQPGRNYSCDTLAKLTSKGEVFVLEGRHRAIGAAKGKQIDARLGGIPDRPGWLDYEFSPNEVDYGGLRVRDLDVDYKLPEAHSEAEALQLRAKLGYD